MQGVLNEVSCEQGRTTGSEACFNALERMGNEVDTFRLAGFVRSQRVPAVSIHGYGGNRSSWRSLARNPSVSRCSHAFGLEGFGVTQKPGDNAYMVYHQAAGNQEYSRS